MSTRRTPGGKDGRCVRWRPYHLHSAESHKNPEALTFRIPNGLFRPVAGNFTLLGWRLVALWASGLWHRWLLLCSDPYLQIRGLHFLLSPTLNMEAADSSKTATMYQTTRNYTTETVMTLDLGEIKQSCEWKWQNWNWIFSHLTSYDGSLPRHGECARSHTYT